MEILIQAIYFLAVVMVTCANPFLTILMVIATIIDGSFYNIILNYIVPGFLSTATIAFYAAPVLILIAAAKYYDP